MLSTLGCQVGNKLIVCAILQIKYVKKPASGIKSAVYPPIHGLLMALYILSKVFLLLLC